MATSPSSESNATATTEKTTHDEEHAKLDKVGWKALFSFTTRKHVPVLVAALSAAVVAAITLPAIAVLFGFVFRQYTDFASGKTTPEQLRHRTSNYCIYLTVVCISSWIANSVYFALFLGFGELQARSARERIFRTLLQKDIEWYDTRESGITAFLPSIQMLIRDLQISTSVPFGEGVQALVAGLSSLGVAMYFSWNLTLVIICTMPIVYLVMNFLSRHLTKRAHEQSDKLQSALKYITSAVHNIETVKCFNGERYELMRYIEAITRAGWLQKRVASCRSAQLGFMQFYLLSIFFQGFWYGSYLVRTGKENPGDVVTTFWGALMAVENITAFLPQLVVLQKGRVSAARLRSVMEQISKDDVQTSSGVEGKYRPSRCSGDIEFNKVTFAYPTRPTEPALTKSTLFFPAGDTIFVVGRSGSGKSTLGQLLVRFYNPSDGKITIDGTPLDQLDVDWVRENITLVEQHSVLFNETIRRNIAMGRKDGTASAERVKEVAEFALLQQIMQDLPNGLETLVGMKGSSLSGGQRQRVALARARLRDTPILILDESTSALDYVTRAAIIDSLRAWRRGKTTIIITHDISQILPDDFVYILDRAKVVQEGYRRDMEAKIGSAFHTFLDVVPEDEQLKDDVDYDSDEDDMEELLSLYDVSWASQPRTATEAFFEQTFMATPLWSSHRRSGIYRFSMIPERRPSIPDSEHQSDIDMSRPPRLPPKPYAGVNSQERNFRRPPSHLDSPRARSPRPTSAAGRYPRPMSQAGAYPRPMSMARPSSVMSGRSSLRFSRITSENVPIQLDLSSPPPSRTRFSLRKARANRRSKRKATPTPNNAEESAFQVPDLSITHILKTFWPNIKWKSRVFLVAAIACALVHAAATPVFGFMFGKLLSTFYVLENQSALALQYALIIFAIAIIDGLTTWGFQFMFEICAQDWANNLKTEAMRRVLLQPREFFDREENSLSRLAETLDHFAEEARNLPGRFVGISIVVFVMVIIAVIWSLALAWRLALVALGTGPFVYAILASYNAISSHWETLSNEADEAVGQVLHETFVNIRTVRCLLLENHFLEKFFNVANNAVQIGMKRAFYTGSIFGLNFAATSFVSTLLMWFVGWSISTGTDTTVIIQTLNILILSAGHITFIVNYVPQINIARDAGSRLLRLAVLPTDSHEQAGKQRVDSVGDISFDNVHFSYPTRKDHTVLDGISFGISSGECTAVVGSSGSGKSTVASLLLKLYSTSETAKNAGALTVSNRNIHSLDTPTLRSRMAIVSQSPVIFPGTVAENIGYGLSPSSSRATLEKIRAAAQAAGIDEFIMSLPSGYSTVIGEGGSGLSGGQAQRVAIARALVRDPDVLVLDEATSALDVESANIIRDTIQRPVHEERQAVKNPEGNGGRREGASRRRMTVIIITHAREMMSIAEKIVMLDKGRVVEEGGYDELRRKGGAFARLLKGESE